MTIKQKVAGVVFPHCLDIEMGKDVPSDSGSILEDLIRRNLSGIHHYQQILEVLKRCNENGEFEYSYASSTYRLRILGVQLLEVEPETIMERINKSFKPSIQSYHFLSWEDYNALGRPELLQVEEVTIFSPYGEPNSR